MYADEKMKSMPHAQLVYKFAKLISDKDYESASRMLTPSLRTEYNAEKIKKAYINMIHYIPEGEPQEPNYDPPANNSLNVETTLEEWGSKPSNGVGWAYCSICNDGFSEAVAVTVEKHGDNYLIGSIEWGRP